MREIHTLLHCTEWSSQSVSSEEWWIFKSTEIYYSPQARSLSLGLVFVGCTFDFTIKARDGESHAELNLMEEKEKASLGLEREQNA
jgi:hypothetical protein